MKKILIIILFCFTSSLSIAVDNNKQISKVLCDGIVGNYPCAKNIEKYLISKLKGKVVRNEGRLILSLEDGYTIIRDDTPGEFENFYNSQGDPNKKYTLKDYYEIKGYYLIEIHYYEGHSLELINSLNGSSFFISDTPNFSPDKNKFIVIISDDYDDLTKRIEIWSVSESKVELEWFYEPNNWPWIIAEWSNSYSINLNKRGWSKETGEYPEQLIAQIYKKDDKWSIEVMNK